MGKYSYVYRDEIAPEDKGALWVHHEVFNDVSSPLVAEVYNGGSWSKLAGGSIPEAEGEKEKGYQELLKEPLTFEAKADDTKIYFLTYDGEQTRTVEVSTDDGKTWVEFTSELYNGGNDTPIATLNIGQKALVRGDNPDGMGLGNEDSYSAGSFLIDGEAYVYGNIMSLLSKEDFASMKEVPEYAFPSLFANYDDYDWDNAESLFSHPSKELLLPATTLADYCYAYMFNNCASLTVAPELPATTLAEYCYYSMFQNCTSLTVAPELPATTLAPSCYNNMFYICISLIVAPELPATTLANNCYAYMFQNCTSLTVAPKLPATTLADSCYDQMFRNCVNLTAAPELPATTLTNNCYNQMFYGCHRLSFVKCAFTTTPGSSYTNDWLANVFPVGVIRKRGSWTTTGDSGIPDGWTARSY